MKLRRNKFYESIEEMPMYNWLECNRGNFMYLYVEPRDCKITPEIKAQWAKLYDEFIEKVGITIEYENLLRTIKRHGNAILNYILDPSSINRTRMEAAEADIEDMTSGDGGGSFSEFVAAIEKYMGFPIDLKTTSVAKFYAYSKNMKNSYGKENIQQ